MLYVSHTLLICRMEQLVAAAHLLIVTETGPIRTEIWPVEAISVAYSISCTLSPWLTTSALDLNDGCHVGCTEDSFFRRFSVPPGFQKQLHLILQPGYSQQLPADIGSCLPSVHKTLRLQGFIAQLIFIACSPNDTHLMWKCPWLDYKTGTSHNFLYAACQTLTQP